MWFFKKESPLTQPRPYTSIRLEAIGGQGANSAGKILAEAAVLGHGYTGNHFSSFGSEKRGTPVRSFVRFRADKKIVRTAAFIQNPDILVIFHEALILSHPEILSGVTETTDVIVNSKKKPSELNFPLGFSASRIATLPATEISSKVGCGLNVVMLGAISEYCPEVNAANIETVITKFFKKSSLDTQRKNIEGYKLGQEKTRFGFFHKDQSKSDLHQNVMPDLGWINTPIGGVILNPGNTIIKDHSASRKGTVPRLYKEICFNCGYCDMVCPDFCFIWTPNNETHSAELVGIDYQYCKACQKCVEVCPVSALKIEPEENLTTSEKSLHKFKI